jgi:hypothetical protein
MQDSITVPQSQRGWGIADWFMTKAWDAIVSAALHRRKACVNSCATGPKDGAPRTQ